jgi:methyl-accepting chemotaxis protein
MFTHLSLSQKLYAGFAAVLIIVACLGFFALKEIKGIGTHSEKIVKDNMPGITIAMQIDVMARRNMVLAARHIFETDPENIAAIDKDLEENRAQLDEAFKKYESTITTEKDRQLFEAIGAPRTVFRNLLNEKLLVLSRANKNEEAAKLYNGEFNKAYFPYRDAIVALAEYNIKSGEESGTNISESISSAQTGIISGLIAAILVGAALGFFLSRSISTALNRVIESLSEGSSQVSSASNQVSSSSQSMAEGASEQASSLEETSASLEEMASMTRQNSDNAKMANTTAAETKASVDRSREAMRRMGDAITQIKSSSDQTAKIIKTIDEIAFQTNLLALNAAVEAARAGEAGKGFAVVAEEVRNLAQRSAEAAKNTSALIEESQQNAINGVNASQEVGGILTQVVEKVQSLTQLIGEVANASEEQAKGIDQITTAVSQMDKVTQSNAANAEESASASEELFAQAKELGDMVNVLIGIVKGAGAAHSHTASVERHSESTQLRRPAANMQASRSPAKKGSVAVRTQDWSAVQRPSAKSSAKVAVKSAVAEEVLPLNDNDMRDF